MQHDYCNRTDTSWNQSENVYTNYKTNQIFQYYKLQGETNLLNIKVSLNTEAYFNIMDNSIKSKMQKNDDITTKSVLSRVSE